MNILFDIHEENYFGPVYSNAQYLNLDVAHSIKLMNTLESPINVYLSLIDNEGKYQGIDCNIAPKDFILLPASGAVGNTQVCTTAQEGIYLSYEIGVFYVKKNIEEKKIFLEDL